MDLLGYTFEVWTDHKTLEHFNTQRDLSRRQAHWMEFLSQYDASIHYLPGNQNTVTDALSRLPDTEMTTIVSIFAQTRGRKIRTRFELEDAILDEIKQGYTSDLFTEKLTSASSGMQNMTNKNSLWFIDERLVIPSGRHVCETLFCIAHDKLGHFSTSKSYDALRHSFYWLNMRKDLEQAYIPACADCQRNQSACYIPCPYQIIAAIPSQSTLSGLFPLIRASTVSSLSLIASDPTYGLYRPQCLSMQKAWLSCFSESGTAKTAFCWK
jgi:hypothetical protein